MIGWHHQLNGHESEYTLEDGEGREAWHGAVHRVAKSWTQLSDWTTKEGRFFLLGKRPEVGS